MTPPAAEAREGWSLERLLTEVMGSGPRSAEDMTREQAFSACERILAGDPDPTTLGAFLLANRWKGNTPEELAAFVDAMRRDVRTAEPAVDPVDCGANYDGKTETALLGVAAGVVAAAAGTPVVVHSADRVPASQGVTYRHVLDELGVPTDLTPAESARMVEEVGFGFYYRPNFAPAVAALLERRERVGVRTAFNTVETLANPADADVHLGSFYHLTFAHRVIETVRESRTLDVDRVLMVQGLEGYDDVRPGVVALAEFDGRDADREGGETDADDGSDGAITDRELSTADLGFDADRAALAVEDVAADSARLTREVLAGNRDGAVADAVAVNAGLRIYAHGDAASIADGVEIARDVLAAGVDDVLADLREFEP